jgi:NAD(P)-dependent dehydrogenase (short-subunit alcohol dehydrogenase family)
MKAAQHGFRLLNGKVAVITGGNSGIGLATAQEFHHHGARVAILGRDLKSLESAARHIGDGTLTVQGDVRELQSFDRLYQATTQRFGKIDILVANAGIAKFAPLTDVTEALFDEVCGVNFKGAFFTVQKALPYLQDGASVILVGAADADKRGLPLQSIYSATKAAVRSLARTLSAELLPRRIRVNVLSPGMTDTPILTRDVGLSSDFRDALANAITGLVPVRWRGTPEEMARAMLYLAGADSQYVLGTELVVDGGFSQVGTGS